MTLDQIWKLVLSRVLCVVDLMKEALPGRDILRSRQIPHSEDAEPK